MPNTINIPQSIGFSLNLSHEDQQPFMDTMAELISQNCETSIKILIDAEGKKSYVHTIRFPIEVKRNA
jgi:hypothetical protein